MENAIKEMGSRGRMTRKRKREAQKRKIKRRIRRFIILPFTSMIIAIAAGVFLIRIGVFPWVQEFLVTSAMTTMSHKYIADIFANDQRIGEIMNSNRVVENYEKFDGSIVKENANGDSIAISDISREGYTGYMVTVSKPERVFLGTSKKLGEYGTKIAQMTEDYGALAGINAGGFSDENGKGRGGTPTGIIIENGIIKYLDKTRKVYNIVGFNRDNILVVGKYTLSQIDGLNLRDAVDFRPYLIVNGKPTKMYGNGGWGIAPRTAIGQREDGTVLLAVIDGRQLHSPGATMKQLQQIMLENGAVNAANLDGGSSSVMYFRDKIVNSPSSSAGDRYLPSAFLVSGDGIDEENIINSVEK